MSTPFPILMYHSIDDTCTPAYRRWTVSPDRFRAQLERLRALNAVPLTISKLAAHMRKGTLPERAIAITFDDGLQDFARHALPILREFDLPSTLFVTTGYVGETARWLGELGEGHRPMLTWDELASLGHYKVELGAHTHSHPQLDLLPTDEAAREIVFSRQLLADRTGQSITSFAYPHGYSSRAVRQVVAGLGFTAVCRVADALSDPGEDPLALSRVIVTEETSDLDLTRMMRGKSDRIAPPVENWKIRLWRGYRHLKSMVPENRETHP